MSKYLQSVSLLLIGFSTFANVDFVPFSLPLFNRCAWAIWRPCNRSSRCSSRRTRLSGVSVVNLPRCNLCQTFGQWRRAKKAGEHEKAGERKTAGLSPALTRFSRQFVFSNRFSDYLEAWNRLTRRGFPATSLPLSLLCITNLENICSQTMNKYVSTMDNEQTLGRHCQRLWFYLVARQLRTPSKYL